MKSISHLCSNVILCAAMEQFAKNKSIGDIFESTFQLLNKSTITSSITMRQSHSSSDLTEISQQSITSARPLIGMEILSMFIILQ